MVKKWDENKPTKDEMEKQIGESKPDQQNAQQRRSPMQSFYSEFHKAALQKAGESYEQRAKRQIEG